MENGTQIDILIFGRSAVFCAGWGCAAALVRPAKPLECFAMALSAGLGRSEQGASTDGLLQCC